MTENTSSLNHSTRNCWFSTGLTATNSVSTSFRDCDCVVSRSRHQTLNLPAYL